HPIDEVTRLLELDGVEKRGRYVDAFALQAIAICAARTYLAVPEVEPVLIGLATKKVEILLADKVTGAVERIQAAAAAVCRGRKRCLSVHAQQAETAAARIESEVHQIGRYRVHAIGLDVT